VKAFAPGSSSVLLRDMEHLIEEDGAVATGREPYQWETQMMECFALVLGAILGSLGGHG
jgi:hypothetical protein